MRAARKHLFLRFFSSPILNVSAIGKKYVFNEWKYILAQTFLNMILSTWI